MKVKLWGIRGSLPTPLAPQEVEEKIVKSVSHFVRGELGSEDDIRAYLSRRSVRSYGGNTTCVQVSSQKQNIIIDAGSGIRALGQALSGQKVFHIFFTHFHWDHLLGLGFFEPIFSPSVTVHFYAVQPELEGVIRTVFKKPFFPVAFEDLRSKIFFHALAPRKPKLIGDIEVTPYELDHPDPCWGYRIVQGGKVFSFCVDTEATRASAVQLGPDLPLYQGVDLMVFDAQYTITEAAHRTSWGHAAAWIGLDIAMREGIKKVYFVHYDPNSSDEMIAHSERMTRDYYSTRIEAELKAGRKIHKVEWRFAREGDEIVL